METKNGAGLKKAKDLSPRQSIGRHVVVDVLTMPPRCRADLKVTTVPQPIIQAVKLSRWQDLVWPVQTLQCKCKLQGDTKMSKMPPRCLTDPKVADYSSNNQAGRQAPNKNMAGGVSANIAMQVQNSR